MGFLKICCRKFAKTLIISFEMYYTFFFEINHGNFKKIKYLNNINAMKQKIKYLNNIKAIKYKINLSVDSRSELTSRTDEEAINRT